MLIEERPAPAPGTIPSGKAAIYTYSRSAGKRLITPDGMCPSWTTSSGRIIFVRDNQIWTMNADGSGALQAGDVGNLMPLMPQMGLSGDIVFVGADPAMSDGNPGIWTMTPYGSGLREIARGNMPYLSWSGTWLTFTHQTSNPQHRQIWRVNVDGSGLKQLTFNDGADSDSNASSISKDDQWVACFRGKEASDDKGGSVFDWGRRNVAVIPAEGGAPRFLTSCQPVKTPQEMSTATTCIASDNPDWFPDGSGLIVDVGWRDRGNTYAVDLSGANFREFYWASRGTVRRALRAP